MYVNLEASLPCCGLACTDFHVFSHAPNSFAANTILERMDFPLPPVPESVEKAGGFNYPNSNGFQFEAEAIHQCIRDGKTSCPVYPSGEMVAVR